MASLLLTAVSCILVFCNSQNVNYYVSTSGSDSTGDGSQSKPWATIQTAQTNVAKKISTLNKNSFTGNITINIESGIYYGPLSFTPSDSMTGFTKNNYVIYKSTTPGSTSIYGSKNITSSWTKSTKNGLNLYTTNLKGQPNPNGKVYDLYIASDAGTSTRVGMSKSKLFTYDSINTKSKQILTNSTMISNIAAIMATNYSMNLMALVYEHWTSSYHFVTNIDYEAKSGQITITLHTWYVDIATIYICSGFLCLFCI